MLNWIAGQYASRMDFTLSPEMSARSEEITATKPVCATVGTCVGSPSIPDRV